MGRYAHDFKKLRTVTPLDQLDPKNTPKRPNMPFGHIALLSFRRTRARTHTLTTHRVEDIHIYLYMLSMYYLPTFLPTYMHACRSTHIVHWHMHFNEQSSGAIPFVIEEIPRPRHQSSRPRVKSIPPLTTSPEASDGRLPACARAQAPDDN